MISSTIRKQLFVYCTNKLNINYDVNDLFPIVVWMLAMEKGCSVSEVWKL